MECFRVLFFYSIGKFLPYRIKKHDYAHSRAAELSLTRPRSARSVRHGAHFFIKAQGRKGMEEYKIIDHYLMIRLPEEIDHNSCKNISRRADHMLLDNEVSHVVFDFSDTKFMDSSGVGVLAGRYRKISCFGGKVYVIHADNRILRILKMSGLEKIVEIME